MKVFIVTKNPFPNGRAATHRVKCYARSLIEGGANCEIIICKRTECKDSFRKNIKGKGVYEGVPYSYIGGTPFRSNNNVLRYIYERLDEKRAERYLKKTLSVGDILFLYMGNDVKLMLHLMNIAHSKGAFCVRDLCELPYGTGAETEDAIRMRKITLEKQFPQLDGVISISDALQNLAKKYTLPSCKHIKVPILVEFNQYKLPDKSSLVDVPYIFHSGTLFQQKDGILGMIEAFGKAAERLSFPVKFISTGTVEKSPHKEEINRLIAQYHLEDKIIFTGYLTDEQVKDYLSKASMVIINKYRTQQNNYCFSTKLGEYLAASKPVIITKFGEAVNWLENGKSAIITEPEDTEALADAIVRVFENPEKSRKIGLAGQEVCRNSFDYRNWSKPLVEFMKQLGNYLEQ